MNTDIKKNKDRIPYIDYLRAIAIFLVVFSHSGIPQCGMLRALIYGFHMPFFMFLSGFFAKMPISLLFSIKKNINSLLIPYLFFSLFLIPFNFFMESLIRGRIEENVLIYILKKLLMDDKYSCGPIWFLGGLMVCRLLFDCLSICVMSCYRLIDKIQAFIFIILLFGLLHLDFNHIVSICSIDSAFVLFPFYLSGWLYKQFVHINKDYSLLIGLSALILYLLIVIRNGVVDFDQMLLGNNIFVTYLAAGFGCLSMFATAERSLSKIKLSLLMGIGRNSLTIMGLHIIFTQFLRFVYKYICGEVIPLWYLFFISLVACFICYACAIIFLRINPRLIGQ